MTTPQADSALLAPSAALAGCVRAFYWHDLRPLAQGGAQLTLEQRLTYIPPGPYNAVVWLLDGRALLLQCAGQPVPQELPASFVAGAHRQAYRSLALTPYCSFGLVLQPAALALLSGLDMAAQVDRISPAPALLPPDWQPLLQQVAQAPDHGQRIALIEAFLLPRWRALQGRRHPWLALAAQAWQRGTQDAALAAARWTQRHYQRRHRALVGLRPGEVQRLLRLEQALLALRDGRSEGLAQAAQDHGYADQPHFTREVRAWYQRSPTELTRRLADPAAQGDWLLRL